MIKFTKPRFLVSILFLSILVTINTAYAVPPPDFIFNIGSSLAQVFSIVVLFLSAIFGFLYKYIKLKLDLLGKKKFIVLSILAIGIIGISIGSAYFYDQYQQNAEYNKWLQESNAYTNLAKEKTAYEEQNKVPTTSVEVSTPQLEIQPEVKVPRIIAEEKTAFVDLNKEENDKVSTFIKDYYKAIADHDFAKAYAMSKRSTTQETFASWYEKVTSLSLDKLIRIDATSSSLELTLYEGDTYTRYGVVMYLKLSADNTPIEIADSKVRILSTGTFQEKGDTVVTNNTQNVDNFFTENNSSSLSISNNNFQKVLDSGKSDYIVLDARENLEYENGYFPGSIHVRFADLKAGKWIELPTDKFIYVLCWSGIRGKEVTEFLRSKDITASYLESGANGWVDFGGKWVGNIKFGEKYTDTKYSKTFSTKEVKGFISEGVILVDCREPWVYEKSHVQGSISLPIMYTPTKDLENAFSMIPENTKVVTVCDGYVNCFDAKITGVELESRGHEFLGRYNKPWEYE